MADAWFTNMDLLLLHQTVYGTLVEIDYSDLADFAEDEVSYFVEALTDDRFSVMELEEYLSGDSFPEGPFLSESAPLVFAKWTATGDGMGDMNAHLKRAFTMFVRP